MPSRGPIRGRKADRCYDCNHMRRYHRVAGEIATCSRCYGRHPTQDRAKWAHAFVPYPNDEEEARPHAPVAQQERSLLQPPVVVTITEDDRRRPIPNKTPKGFS